MKTYLFLTMILLVFSFISNGMARFSDEDYNRRGMLIFLDDSETKKIAAISGSLLTALSQSAGPIIASASLLKLIFSPKGLPLAKSSAKDLEGQFRIERLRESRGDADYDVIRQILLKALNFKPNQWVYKKINETFYMLIPNDYLDKLGVSLADVKKSEFDLKKITDVELQLGIKINHMENVDFSHFSDSNWSIPSPGKPFIDTVYDPSTNKSDIFCLRSDYSSFSVNKPLWSFYMEGHGLMSQTIVGMQLREFQNLLDFFERKINTQLLVYTSCYAAGLNNEMIFKDAQNTIERSYSYAIITQALTDAPTTDLRLEVKDKNGVLSLVVWRNYAEFIKEVTQEESINYEKAMTAIYPLMPRDKQKKWGLESWGDVPQIKLPGVEWFSVMASQKDIVSIGSILSKTRKEPLDIVNFFKTDPKAMLLRTYEVPFELVINSKNMEAIISMIPGRSIHKIKKISSKENRSEDIIDWFMKIRELDAQKIFYIQELNSYKDVIILLEKTSKGGMGMFEEFVYKQEAFFVDNGKMYVRSNKQSDLQNQAQEIKYKNLLAQFKQGVQELGPFTFKAERFIQFPAIKANMRVKISKIEGIGDAAYLSIYFSELRRQNTIVWIEEMIGAYDGGVLKGLNLNYGDSLILRDVIIDSTQIPEKIFFTYDNKFYQASNNGIEKESIPDYTSEYKKRMLEKVVAPEKEGIEFTAEKAQELEKMLAKKQTQNLKNVLVELEINLLALSAVTK